MLPCQASRVEAVEIAFDDQARFQKIIVLLGSWDWAKDVKRRPVGRNGSQNFQVVTNRFLGVLREPDDIGKVGADPVVSTVPDYVVIRIRPILLFVCGDQCFPVKGFDSNKYLVAASPSKQFHKALLFCNLGVALNKEFDLKFFFDHRFKQELGLWVFIEIVRSEHDRADP